MIVSPFSSPSGGYCFPPSFVGAVPQATLGWWCLTLRLSGFLTSSFCLLSNKHWSKIYVYGRKTPHHPERGWVRQHHPVRTRHHANEGGRKAAPHNRKRWENTAPPKKKKMGYPSHRPCPAPPPRKRRSGKHHHSEGGSVSSTAPSDGGRSSPSSLSDGDGRLNPPPPTLNSFPDGNPTHPETTNFKLRKLHGFGNASRSSKKHIKFCVQRPFPEWFLSPHQHLPQLHLTFFKWMWSTFLFLWSNSFLIQCT